MGNDRIKKRIEAADHLHNSGPHYVAACRLCRNERAELAKLSPDVRKILNEGRQILRKS